MAADPLQAVHQITKPANTMHTKYIIASEVCSNDMFLSQSSKHVRFCSVGASATPTINAADKLQKQEVLQMYKPVMQASSGVY
jgi:hypothetical protein